MDAQTVLAIVLPIIGTGGGIWGLHRWAFARVDRYQARIEARLAEVEADNANCNRRFNLVLRAFYPVVSALRRHDPLSPELAEAGSLLDEAFKVEPVMPPDMQALLDKLP